MDDGGSSIEMDLDTAKFQLSNYKVISDAVLSAPGVWSILAPAVV